MCSTTPTSDTLTDPETDALRHEIKKILEGPSPELPQQANITLPAELLCRLLEKLTTLRSQLTQERENTSLAQNKIESLSHYASNLPPGQNVIAADFVVALLADPPAGHPALDGRDSSCTTGSNQPGLAADARKYTLDKRTGVVTMTATGKQFNPYLGTGCQDLSIDELWVYLQECDG